MDLELAEKVCSLKHIGVDIGDGTIPGRPTHCYKARFAILCFHDYHTMFYNFCRSCRRKWDAYSLSC